MRINFAVFFCGKLQPKYENSQQMQWLLPFVWSQRQAKKTRYILTEIHKTSFSTHSKQKLTTKYGYTKTSC